MKCAMGRLCAGSIALAEIAALRRLQVAHATTDLPIRGITSGLPEGAGVLVLEGDESRHPAHAAAMQVLLPRPRQREPDALAPMLLGHREPVHVAAPPIPRGDQGTDNFIVANGDQESGWRIFDEPLNIIKPIGRARVLTPLLRPKAEDRLRVLPPASKDREFLGSQVGSVANRGAGGRGCGKSS
jgi:hypothetical protein